MAGRSFAVGHYYFICEAKRKNVERYAYIYDSRGVQAALHYDETEGKPNGLDQPPEMTEQRRKDRVSFEVGANNFAIDMLEKLGVAGVRLCRLDVRSGRCRWAAWCRVFP